MKRFSRRLAKSTLVRDKQDIDRFLPFLGNIKLTDLRAEHFRSLYAEMRKQKNLNNGKPLSESTVEGIHACLCGILTDAMEGGFLDHNPAWRTYKYAGKKRKRNIADEETTQKLIAALEKESIKYETYFMNNFLLLFQSWKRSEKVGSNPQNSRIFWGSPVCLYYTVYLVGGSGRTSFLSLAKASSSGAFAASSSCSI